MTRTHSKTALLLATALGAGLIGLQAQAQEAENTAVEEIVVTGYREALASALNQKRLSNAAIDVINAEDIADFPDANLAESIQRLPGITIDRENGEGRQITVRGLGGDILLEWADAELAAGRVSDAVKHYQAALEDRRLPPERRRRLLASLVLACRAGGDEDGARRWAKELGDDAESQVASLALRLNRPSARSPGPVATAITAPPGTIPADPTALLPAIHRRYEWHARPIRSNHVPMTPVTSITVHHSDSPASFSPADQIHDIQRLHVVDFGWADIGYHYAIDPAGRVWQGRPLGLQGAHVKVANPHNLGICVLGNFERQSPSPAALRTLEDLISTERARFGVSLSAVHTHQEFAPTACPGRSLQSAMNQTRSAGGRLRRI